MAVTIGGACWCLVLVLSAVFGAFPIYVLEGIISEVTTDVETWKNRIFQVEESIMAKNSESAQLANLMAEKKSSLQLFVEQSIEAGKELQHLHDTECNIVALNTRHAGALREARLGVETGAVPEMLAVKREAKLDIALFTAHQKAREEEVPWLRAQIETLTEDLRLRRIEVEVGEALVDNDSVYLQALLGRMTLGVDSYPGSYMLNMGDVPPLNKPLMLPKINNQEESIGLVTQDLLDVLPKMDPFIKPSRVVYRTCAVVGSSGLLLFHQQGAAIDAHQAVVRFNAAPTAGFEEFVGTKTTVRFVNRLHFGFQEKTTETVLQQVTTEEALQQFLTLKKEMPAQRFFMVAPSFHKLVVSQLVKPPTNGLYGVVFALQRCQQISLFGFFRGSDAHVPYHYFDTDAPVGNQRKRDVSEWPLILDLARRSHGRMHIQEPCQTPEEQAGTQPCVACAPGSTCQLGSGLPVAIPGYCMESGVANCFHKCDDPNSCLGHADSECGDKPHKSECETIDGLT